MSARSTAGVCWVAQGAALAAGVLYPTSVSAKVPTPYDWTASRATDDRAAL